jgi:hypothetical protein
MSSGNVRRDSRGQSYGQDGQLVSLGYQQLAVSNVAVALTVPAGATQALIELEGLDAVRWRSDGVNPTAAVGMRIQPTASISYSGRALILALRFIRVSVDVTLNIEYYR